MVCDDDVHNFVGRPFARAEDENPGFVTSDAQFTVEQQHLVLGSPEAQGIDDV